LDAGELLTEGADFLLEASERTLVRDREDNSGQASAEREELDDWTFWGFGRSWGLGCGGHRGVSLGLG